MIFMFLRISKHISIHITFFIIVLFAIFYRRNTYFFVLLFAFLHEACHLLMAIILKTKFTNIKVMPYGFELQLSHIPYSKEFLIIFAGPFGSILLALFGFLINNNIMLHINSIIFAINIIPSYPLDGGRLIRVILWKKFGFIPTAKILKILSIISAILILIFSVYPTFSPWLFMIGSLILVRQKNLYHISPVLISREKSSFPLPVKQFYVENDISLIKLVRLFSPYYYTAVVVDNYDLVLTENDILNGMIVYGTNIKIKDLVKKLEKSN